MINKKLICSMLLLYLFPVSGCMKLIDLTKTPKEQQKLSFFERQSQYEQDEENIKNALEERRNTRLITGFSPAGSTFLYSIYTAKTGADFDKALMAKGERFIELYAKEQIEDCSALSIVMIAKAVSYAEKKRFIQKLLEKDYRVKPEAKAAYEFKPTPKDREFAYWTKFNEFAPLIIQEIRSNFDMYEVADILKSKEFWRMLDKQESLL